MYPKPLFTFKQYLNDPNLLGEKISLYPKQKEIITEFITKPYTRGAWAIGRRSGKTFSAAIMALYCLIALGPIYQTCLLPGENFYVFFIANNETQAKIGLRQLRILLNQSPLLKKLIIEDKITGTEIPLHTGGVFKAVTSNGAGLRGFPVAFIIIDEAAHFTSGSGPKTGENLFTAVSPSMAQFGKYGRILLISSPWTKQGIFYKLYEQGRSGDYSTIHAVNYPTWEMNPRITPEFLEDERRQDPIKFNIEYGAEFAADYRSFVDYDLLREAIVSDSPFEFQSKFKYKYFLALDPALVGDAYTAAIGHVEEGNVVIDLFHEFIPSFEQGERTVVDIAEVENWILRQHQAYRFAKIVLDQCQSAATIQRLGKKVGKSRIQELTWTTKSKTEAYSYLKELFNTRRLKMYYHETAIHQFKNLQVIYSAGGRWTVSGGSGPKVDDYCSVVAAIAYLSKNTSTRSVLSYF